MVRLSFLSRSFGGVLALVALALLSLTLGAACKKLESPRIAVTEARVESVSAQGLGVVLRVEATNPNRIALTAQSFTGTATLAGKHKLGTVMVAKPVTLPPNAPTMVDVPLTMPWSDLSSLAALAQSPGPIPYVMEGTVKVGGESLNVDLPYTVSGTITREQLASAAMKSLPQIPGLTFPAPTTTAPARP